MTVNNVSDEKQRLADMLNESENVVFLGGAGVSTESGIPDFRSEAGHFETIRRFGYPPEVLLSASFFRQNPAAFFEYYKSALLVTGAEPNPAHLALARLEREGRLRALITQNIDGLHTKAGSKNVIELHGSIYRNYCQLCARKYDADFIKTSPSIPRCACSGIIKPDVVLYEESLDPNNIERAVSAISAADMLIVGGTSLSVYPAAGLVEYYRGKKLVLINKTPTPYDRRANLIIRAPIGETLGGLPLYDVGAI